MGYCVCVYILCSHRVVTVQRLCGFCTEIIQWLCDRVVLGIRVSNVYNFSFLIEMATKTCKTSSPKGNDRSPESQQVIKIF